MDIAKQEQDIAFVEDREDRTDRAKTDTDMTRSWPTVGGCQAALKRMAMPFLASAPFDQG